MKILVIGIGNMGTTYALSFLKSHTTKKENLLLLVRSEEKADALREKDFGQVFTDASECLPLADVVVISVKPQDSQALFQQIKTHVHPQQLFMSVMAGIRLQTICESLGAKKVIRAMPNLPSQIGQGMTAFTSTDEVTRLELVMVQNLLNTTGKTVYVSDEALIDAATAISGSGPAYVFKMMDAMMQTALELGFNEAEAELLVYQTFSGAVDLYGRHDFSCSEWITKVASKGGTTEAALQKMNENNLNQVLDIAIKAAFERAKALGQ